MKIQINLQSLVSLCKKHYKKTYFLCLSICSLSISAQVSGIVFEDYNANGIKDNTVSFNEIGRRGISVTGYGADGTTYGPVTTTSDGSYTLAGVNQPTRIEFTWSEAFLSASSGGGTSVQFVNGASSNINFGVLDDAKYCSGDVEILTACFVRGQIADNSEPSVISTFVSDAKSSGSAIDAFDTDHNVNIPVSAVGSIWGIAYGKNCDKLLLASGVKGQSDMGPNGVGAIYIADNSTNSTTNSVTTAPLWLDLEALGLEFGTNPYDNIPYQPFDINRDAYAFIGKAGIGDIDISDDGNFLYLTNLHNRSLVKVPIGANCTAPTSAANIIETNIPNPLSCDDIVRPWATKYHEGKVYVGMVCTGEQANVNVDTKAQVNREDLRAYVYIYDPSTDQFETNPVLEFSLLYDRTWSARECPAAWQPWQDRFVYDLLFVRTQNGFASYPQPILSDIEFDGCEMLLAFSDRMGSQFGRAVPPSSELSDGSFVNQGTGNAIQIMPAGDMLIAGYNGNGTWTLEDNGMVTSICGNRTTTNADPNTNRRSENPVPYNNTLLGSGPGTTLTNATDFFWYDGFGQHNEVFIGSAAIIPGSNEIINMSYDGVFTATGVGGDGFNIGSLTFNNTTNGVYTRGTMLYDGVGTNVNFGKGAGFGDVEVLCKPAPIEIGNLVWYDANENGIQDAGENGIQGVSVQLLDDGGSLVATAITNANGNYFFSSNPDLTTTANAIYNLNLNFEETYTIRIPNAVGNSQQGVLDTYEITAQNNDATINGDSRDSDGSQTENSDINIILGQAGDNNHTYDFGFKIAAVCSIDNVDLTNTNCQDPLTPTEPNDDRIQFFITVSGTDLSTAGYTVSMTQNGTPLIVAPDANGEYDTNEMFRTQNGFAGNGDLIVTITDNDDASCTAQITINDTGTCSTTPLCPVLSNISQTSDICSSTCVPSFSVSTDQTDGSIDFVYFTSQQTGSDMYVSGTLIGNATIQTNGNAILTPASGTGFSFPANTSTLPITYYVYAIISPSPTDVSCRPSLETTVIVQPNPDVSITTNPSCNTDGTFNLGITIVESGNFTIEFADNFSQVNCGLITAQNVAATFSSTGNNTENIFTVVEGTYNILITNNDTNCRTLIDGPIGENNCDCSPKKCIRVVLTKK